MLPNDRIIPEYIASHPDLNSGEILFYSLILSHINRYGFCSETNKYFSQKSKVSAKTIRRYFEKLISLDLIRVEYIQNHIRHIGIDGRWNDRENIVQRCYEENQGNLVRIY
jgi:hypothetical protein